MGRNLGEGGEPSWEQGGREGSEWCLGEGGRLGAGVDCAVNPLGFSSLSCSALQGVDGVGAPRGAVGGGGGGC